MMNLKAKRILWLLLAVIVSVGLSGLLSRILPAKVKALDPVIAELQKCRNQAGGYPADPTSLASVRRLREEYRLYFGFRNGTNLMWDAADVSKHDLSVLVETNYFVLFAPVGQIKPWSFSSFPVWQRTPDDSRWRKGRIHWSLLGAYWSKD